MLGLILLYVGAVLFINALSMLGLIAPKEAAIMNIFTGGLSLFVAVQQIEAGDAVLIRAAAFGLLFSFTYLWVAYVNLSGADGRGLGWFSLFVAITAVPVAADTLLHAQNTGDVWLGWSWAALRRAGLSVPAWGQPAGERLGRAGGF